VTVRWCNHDVAGLCVANDVQREAVRHALVHSFSLIQGPPGTGKTITAVRLACLFVRINHSLPVDYERHKIRPQLMVCGPSNKSVDVVTSKLMCETYSTLHTRCLSVMCDANVAFSGLLCMYVCVCVYVHIVARL